MVTLGIENLLKNTALRRKLKGKRIALLANQASVNQKLEHSLDLCVDKFGKDLKCAFGPQHGMRGEKQDNMIESDHYIESKSGITVFSLYGEVRRPSRAMLEQFDVILVDMQDVGCRIYTFLTTLFYILEDCAKAGKSVWVLDRPNPAGRFIEGNKLRKSFFSFVGGAEIPMRHGLTLGEAGAWYKDLLSLDVDYKVVPMGAYKLSKKAEWGWPADMTWVNPSPNMPRIETARMYAGTVLIEGTTLSEGRGTTRPLEVLGAPGVDGEALIQEMTKVGFKKTPGVVLRPCYFEPTFQKHARKLCGGFQIHIDRKDFDPAKFKPYRLVCSAFKAFHDLYPDRQLWNPPPYEYEKINMPIDILSGDSSLRDWVETPGAKLADLNSFLLKDEKAWEQERKAFLLYK